jgi:hypothetical protein
MAGFVAANLCAGAARLGIRIWNNGANPRVISDCFSSRLIQLLNQVYRFVAKFDEMVTKENDAATKFVVDSIQGRYLSLLSIDLGAKVFAVSDDGPNGFCPGER